MVDYFLEVNVSVCFDKLHIVCFFGRHSGLYRFEWFHVQRWIWISLVCLLLGHNLTVHVLLEVLRVVLKIWKWVQIWQRGRVFLCLQCHNIVWSWVVSRQGLVFWLKDEFVLWDFLHFDLISLHRRVNWVIIILIKHLLLFYPPGWCIRRPDIHILSFVLGTFEVISRRF